ncbi:MAG: hypothetical protein OXG70_00830, partial [Cyanobacteria bacterium MAG IRC1_bin_28]|nr:hypothetical protein [Cyanobacteria bacterium MAG IRC1_bin_28]
MILLTLLQVIASVRSGDFHKMGTMVTGISVLAVMLPGFVSPVAAQTTASISPTEIYEGESVTFTVSDAGIPAHVFNDGQLHLRYASGGSTVSLGDVRAGYTFAAVPGNTNTIIRADHDFLSYSAEQTSYSFVVTAAADAVDKDEKLSLRFFTDYGDATIPTITLKDGVRPVSASDGVTVSEFSIALTEGHASDVEGSYTIKLKTDPGADVSIAVSSSDTSAATVSPATLTFTGSSSGNWATAQK